MGWRAAGVPGTVRGLELAHQKYGRKPWAELLDPAIELASDGFPVSYSLDAVAASEERDQLLSQFPESKRIFLGAHYGDKLVQPELAATLERIRDRGASDFYEGETAQKLAAAMAANGGLITLEDLKAYQAVEREPLHGRYHGYEIITAPPPSAGGVGIAADARDAGRLGLRENRRRLGRVDPLRGRGDAARSMPTAASTSAIPDFVKVPVQKLLDPRVSSRAAAPVSIRSTPRPAIRFAPGTWAVDESTETTHFNIVDSDGNAVAVTYTLEQRIRQRRDRARPGIPAQR